jgi:Right handed beta helix region
VRRVTLVLLTAAALALFGASPAAAATLRVDDDRAQCPDAAFTTVQSAVTAAGPGDRVQVCAGTYREQVRIEGPGKNGLSLEARQPLQAVIQAPVVDTPPNAVVLVRGARGVGIRGFVISGPFTTPGCSETLLEHSGVRVDGDGQATVQFNRITQIRNANPALFGCQDGIAVRAGRAGEMQRGSITLSFNLIDEYQKGGVVVDGPGSFGRVERNVIRASEDVQPLIAPNGVQISRGAGARVRQNLVSENIYLPGPDNGTGILLFQLTPDLVEVEQNEVFENDNGIALSDADGTEIRDNRSRDQARFDGISVNSMSSDNLIVGNEAFQNARFDCRDASVGSRTAGTANTWRDNEGETENRPGLCEADDDDDEDEEDDD